MRRCSKCTELKPEDAFVFNKKRNLYESWCRVCKNIVSVERYAESRANSKRLIIERNKQVIVQYLSDNPCVDCGEEDIEVLEFDHIVPVGKTARRISSFVTYSTKRLLEEISKCEVRCANCHTRRTKRMQGWLRNQ